MKQTTCPKCNAKLPAKGRFCLDCGLDLYGEGLRRAPIPWGKIIGLPLLVAGGIAFLVIGPCQSSTPPEAAVVTRAAQDFLRLVGAKDYAGAVDRFYAADAKRFAEAEGKLHSIFRGEGAPGLNIARSHSFRTYDDLLGYVHKHGTRYPEYVARLLYAVLSQPEPNPWLSSRRTELFFAWYLEQAFEGTEASRAELASDEPRWDDRVLVVTVRYPTPSARPSGVADPSTLRWRLVGGGWGGCSKQSAVLDFGRDDHLDEVLDFLKRLPAE